ncbi:hypothetical protein [Verminephrobacter aporrectodeae]|uniref:hypothetical protein n=1 Tax=Verminephrobacter aporrectodeae TaxID=1110389 RepID=UPI0011105B77|nr:hypothetical protein [Verminephrobacter aporrectodeae]
MSENLVAELLDTTGQPIPETQVNLIVGVANVDITTAVMNCIDVHGIDCQPGIDMLAGEILYLPTRVNYLGSPTNYHDTPGYIYLDPPTQRICFNFGSSSSIAALVPVFGNVAVVGDLNTLKRVAERVWSDSVLAFDRQIFRMRITRKAS